MFSLKRHSLSTILYAYLTVHARTSTYALRTNRQTGQLAYTARAIPDCCFKIARNVPLVLTPLQFLVLLAVIAILGCIRQKAIDSFFFTEKSVVLHKNLL